MIVSTVGLKDGGNADLMGWNVGIAVGELDVEGKTDGASEGNWNGWDVGITVIWIVGAMVGDSVGSSDGE